MIACLFGVLLSVAVVTMALLISDQQFRDFDERARDGLFADIDDELSACGPEMPADRRRARLAACREDCRNFGFEGDYAIWCYCLLCFQTDTRWALDAGFREEYRRYLATYGDVDQLPIDLWEVAEQCGA